MNPTQVKRRASESELTLAIKTVLAKLDMALTAYEIFECLPETVGVYDGSQVNDRLKKWRRREQNIVLCHPVNERNFKGQPVRWRYSLNKNYFSFQ